MDSRYVLDSYALIAHLEGERSGEQVGKILHAAVQKKTALFLSIVNLGEIYYTAMRERSREQAEGALSLIGQLPITIVDADRTAAIEAARLKARHSVAYADCFAAALGIIKGAAVVTGDPEFRKFGEAVKVVWL